MLDLVHALPDTDGSREVIHMRHTVQRLVHGVPIADVAALTLHLAMQMRRETTVIAMNLRLEHIQDAYPVACFHQRICKVRTDEAGAAGDENPAIPIDPAIPVGAHRA